MKHKVKKTLSREIRAIALLTIGSVMFAFNLKSFVMAGELLPSGVSGAAVLIQRCFAEYANLRMPFTPVYVILNLPAVYIGFRYIGKKFTFYSLYATIILSLIADAMPYIPITSDILLISVFGGILNGLAAVVCLLSGASAGGVDFFSIYLSEKKGIDAWNYILIGNVIILVIAGVLFGFDKALYSVIFQYVGTQILTTLYKRYRKHTLLIVTEHNDEVYQHIKNLTNHDATLFRGEGCYKGAPRKMLYSVVSSDEVSKVIKTVREVDPNAFINSLRTEQLEGFFYRPKR